MKAAVSEQKFNKFLKNNYEGWLFNLPLIIGLAVFTVIPVISSLRYSLYNYNVFTAEFVGFKNFIDIFTKDREIAQVVRNTLVYTFVSVPLSMVLSYLLAWLVNRDMKGVKGFRVLYYLPCLIPAVVSGLLWKDMLDRNYGVFNKLLGAVGFSGDFPFLQDASTAMLSIFIMNLWLLGGNMILWLASFRNIPKQLYEAADIDGAGAAHKFFKITIPMSAPMIFYNLIISIIGTLQYNGTLTFAAGSGGMQGTGPDKSIYMYTVKIYNDAILSGRIGYGSALAWLLLIVIGAITAVLFKTSSWVFYGEDA